MMQTRSWKQTLCSAGGAALLLAVPPLVLGIFSPRLSQCFAAEVSPVRETALRQAPLAQLKVESSPAEAAAELDSWVDTFNPTPEQVAQLNANLAAEFQKYKIERANRFLRLLRIYDAKYRGERRHTYHILLYKNLTIENISFIKYQYLQIIALYRDGFIQASPSPYRFVALR